MKVTFAVRCILPMASIAVLVVGCAGSNLHATIAENKALQAQLDKMRHERDQDAQADAAAAKNAQACADQIARQKAAA